jgi:hypothetical protein
LSARYDTFLLADESGYQFTTSDGDVYIAYFTEFTLIDSDQNEISATSFGFANKGSGQKHQYDVKIKNTIVHLIREFFESQNDAAILYICINNDGRERNRHITFGRWFNEMNNEFERYSSSGEHAKAGFYSSIIFKSTNQRRLKLIEAFYFTIAYYWRLGESEQ